MQRAYGRAVVWMVGAAIVALAGCVDVPTRVDLDQGAGQAPDGRLPDGALADGSPADRGPLDADVRDGRLPDAALPDAALPDAALPDDGGGADQGPSVPIGVPPGPLSECLSPLVGPLEEDHPCLQVQVVAPIGARVSHGASVTVRSADRDRQQVVVAGGLDLEVDGQGLDAVRVYDPEADLWRAGPPLASGRWGHGIAQFEADGEAGHQLVIIGGAPRLEPDGEWEGLGSMLVGSLLDVRLDPFGDPIAPRSDGTLLQPEPGLMLYVGGAPRSDAAPTAAVNVITARFAVFVVTLDQARRGPLVGSGGGRSTVVLGGRGADQRAVAGLERIGGDGGLVRDLAPVARPTAFGGAADLPDGALFVGGADDEGRPTTRAWRFQGDVARLVPVGELAVGRIRPTVSPIGPVGEGWRLVVGGEVPAAARPGVVEVYDPRRDRFVAFELPPELRRHRARHTAASFTDEHARVALVVGGYDPLVDPRAGGAYRAETLRFELTPPEPLAPLPRGCLAVIDSPTETQPCLRVSRGPTLAAGRAGIGAVAATDGRVVISGGYDPAAGQVSDEAAQLTLGARRWQPLPALIEARWGHSMAVEDDAEPSFLAIGGARDYAVVDGTPTYDGALSIERLSPPGDGWMRRGALDVGQVHAGVIPVEGGVILTGGQPASGVDVLDRVARVTGGGPAMEPPLLTGRALHSACAIDAQRFMVIGGTAPGRVIESVEVFDEATRAWSAEIDPVAQLSETACLGRDGVVEIFGGRDLDRRARREWLRYTPDGGLARVGQLARERLRPTVSAIGPDPASHPAYLVVGGDPGRAAPALVELVYPTLDLHYTVALPAGLGGRQEHAAVSRRWVAEQVGDVAVGGQDVVVVGGRASGSDAALDEVLIFGLDPFEPSGGQAQPGPEGMQ